MTANTSGGGTDPAGTSLYGRELVGPYDYMCNTDGSNTDMESCLGIAELKGGGYSITGTKPEDSGRELRGTSWTTPKPATVSPARLLDSPEAIVEDVREILVGALLTMETEEMAATLRRVALAEEPVPAPRLRYGLRP